MKFALVVVGVIGVSLLGSSEATHETQDAKGPATNGRTKLEALQTRIGVVIIRGFTTIGAVAGKRDTSIVVQCQEMVDGAAQEGNAASH